MTAVVGILSKVGVAIAADSAVTISSGNQERKIYNSANKIFTLSKYHPVSVMIYNSATFNGIPWEILIKEYRKQLKKKSFKKLLGYQVDFIKYIKSRINLVSKESQEEQIEYFIDFVLSNILESVVKKNKETIENEVDINKRKEIVKKLIKEEVKDYLNNLKDIKLIPDFSDYEFGTFKKRYRSIFNKVFDEYYSEISLGQTTKNNLFQLIFQLVCSDNFLGNWTGLVFTGYGDDEIYPSCFSLKVGGVIDNRIRYIFDEQTIISENMSAGIRPFAQRDVIDLILSGMDSDIGNLIFETFDNFLKQFTNKIGATLENTNPEIANEIRKINTYDIATNFADEIREKQRSAHIALLMATIATLSKEDLAELAESLIYLTYLKRRMSFSEESVGDPVDVAIITKGDGFIWIKRKHYFDSNLNYTFIQNYLTK